MTLLPLNSVVCTVYKPSPDMLYVKGYALPGPKGNVNAVEVSVDNGRSWERMEITYQEGKWSWTIWEGEVNCTEETGCVYSRAIDASGCVQPKEGQWNLRGVAFNGWGKLEW